MSRVLFLAGAGGAIGRRLAPLLVADGWQVFGTTRSAARAEELATLGVEPIVVDVFDGPALTRAVLTARPQVILHQLTDLPPTLDPAVMPEALARNARLRVDGTRNVVAAATVAGASRLVAQSIAFAYREGHKPYAEDAPLAVNAPDPAGMTARAVQSLERQVLAASSTGVVLRYGRLYGPGAWFDRPTGAAPLHVDDAAQAARLAVTLGEPGVYNIAEDDGTVDTRKARAQLGWTPRETGHDRDHG